MSASETPSASLCSCALTRIFSICCAPASTVPSHNAIRCVSAPKRPSGVVVAAKGYPGSYARGMSISGIEEAESSASVQVFQAGTRREGDRLLSSGGRVLCVTALGCDLADARDRAYAALKHISMPDSFYRHDIGLKGLKRLQEKN